MAIPGKRDNHISNIYRINVGGRQFELSRSVMESVDGSKLQRLANETEDRPNQMDFFYERPSGPFEAILAYHQTGSLHIPGDMCPAAFKLELEFWDISPDVLDKCCHHRYLTFLREQAVMTGFMEKARIDEMTNEKHCDKTSSYLTKIRSRMKTVLDNKDESLVTQVYFVFAVAVIILSVLATALGTLPVTPHTNTSSDDVVFTTIQPMVSTSDTVTVPDPPSGRQKLSPNGASIDLGNISPSNWEEWKEKHSSGQEWSTWNETVSDNMFINASRRPFVRRMFAGAFDTVIPEAAQTKLLTLSTATNTEQCVYIYIEYASNAFFSVELLLRLFSFPWTPRNVFCFQNIIEMIVLAAVYIRGLMYLILAEDYHDDIDFLLYVQMLRVLRLLRLLENVTAYRVLCYTLKVGKRDMFIMLLYVLIGVLFFSNVMYVVERREDFPSIPATWWWSVITMTTVGYGDMIPKTAVGKIIGTICALSGVFMFSLIIPIFVNTFLSLYQFADVQSRDTSDKNQYLLVTDRDLDDIVTSVNTIKENGDCPKRQCVKTESV